MCLQSQVLRRLRQENLLNPGDEGYKRAITPLHPSLGNKREKTPSQKKKKKKKEMASLSTRQHAKSFPSKGRQLVKVDSPARLPVPESCLGHLSAMGPWAVCCRLSLTSSSVKWAGNSSPYLIVLVKVLIGLISIKPLEEHLNTPRTFSVLIK